jgi:hypothetical protein
MRSYPAITLFHELPEIYQPSSSFAVSLLLHIATLALLCAGLAFAPQLQEPAHTKHYAVRYLNLHPLKSQTSQNTGIGIAYPRLNSTPANASGGKSSGQQPILWQTAKAAHTSQTLLQPDIRQQQKLAGNLPLPKIIIWNATHPEDKKLLAPLPEKALMASATPSLQRPNQEKNLADIALAASPSSEHAFPLSPSNTSPMALQEHQTTSAASITTTMGSAPSTSAALISLSDLRMAEGTVVLPPANQIAPSGSSAEPGLDKGKNLAWSTANDKGKTPDAETKQGPSHANSSHPTPGATRPGMNSGQHERPSSAPQSDIKAEQNNQFLATHIELPSNGHFGAVIIGSSMEARYPVTAELWGDRLAYTVYLHVGLAKSWILQYSLPSTDVVTSTGDTAQIEAPWPYNIVRPYIAPGSVDADAIIVHGIVNQTGRFQSLSIAFPPPFAQAPFVLASLAQWQFRPARLGEKNISVEVVLIIPDESE